MLQTARKKINCYPLVSAFAIIQMNIRKSIVSTFFINLLDYRCGVILLHCISIHPANEHAGPFLFETGGN
jgi:hypothetical protein